MYVCVYVLVLCFRGVLSLCNISCVLLFFPDSSDEDGSSGSGDGSDVAGGSSSSRRFHSLALKVTSNSSSSSATSMSSGGGGGGGSSLFGGPSPSPSSSSSGGVLRRSPLNLTLHCGLEYGYGAGLEEDLDKICYDAACSASHAAAVSRTIWLRLRDCRMFNWKHGLRGLQLLHVMLLQGPPGILTEALAHYSLIHSLTEVRACLLPSFPSITQSLYRLPYSRIQPTTVHYSVSCSPYKYSF
jgi:hypothetical protein